MWLYITIAVTCIMVGFVILYAIASWNLEKKRGECELRHQDQRYEVQRLAIQQASEMEEGYDE